MKKINIYLIATLLAVCTMVFIIVSSIELAGFSRSVFSYHFKKSNIMQTTKMSYDDLMKSADKLIDYIKGKEDDLVIELEVDGSVREVFNEREKLHMIDVKDLYQRVKIVKLLCLFFMLAIIVLPRKHKFYGDIMNKTVKVIPVLIAFMAVLGSLFAFNFDKYFTKFHLMFFDNDLWILDPETDILINIVPQQYFYGLIMLIVGLAITLTLLFTYLYYRLYKKAKRGLC